MLVPHLKRYVLAVLLSLIAVPGSAAEQGEELKFRIWTDSTGSHEIEAALLKYESGNVHIEKPDGDTIVVPLDRLSRSDQSYVRQELSRRAAQRRRERGRGGSSLKTLPTTPSPPTETKSDTEPPTGTDPDTGLPRPVSWPGWRGPDRNGKSPDTGLLKAWPEGGPPLLWKASGIGRGYSSVAVSGQVVYITGDIGDKLVVSALDPEGKVAWRETFGRSWTKNHAGARATPTLDLGNLYLVSGDGLVGCMSAANGRSRWTARMADFGGQVPGWGYSESVLISGRMAVVTPGGRNCIVALDKTSGKPSWASTGFQAGAQYGSCYAFTHEGVPMIAAGTAEGLVCVDPSDGRMLWANPFSAHNTANCPTPVYSDGYVFWANGYGRGGICMQLSVEDVEGEDNEDNEEGEKGEKGGNVSAHQAWVTKDMVSQHGGYIVHEGYIYGNNGSGWACLELETGNPMWKERSIGKGSLCFADGMLYLFGENGGEVGLATCSPDGMELKGEFAVAGEGMSWAHPVVIGGRLYVRYDTTLYCYDVRARK